MLSTTKYSMFPYLDDHFNIELEIEGVVVFKREITPSRYEIMKQILKRKAQREYRNREWAIFISKSGKRNPRPIENIQSKPIDMSRFISPTTGQEKLDALLNEMCSIFKCIPELKDCTPELIKDKTRKGAVVRLRHLFFYVACTLYKESISMVFIGEYTGQRDHATVLNAKRNIQGYIDIGDTYISNMWGIYTSSSKIWKSKKKQHNIFI